MRPSSTFRTASNSKTFTAAATLRLIETGRLSPDDHLERFLRRELIDRLSVIDGVAHGDEITVRHLLQHTSGLYSPTSETYVQTFVQQPSKRWTALEQVELFISLGAPYGPPGRVVHYSDTGYVLLAIIIELVSGLPLAEAFRRLLRFDELGLNVVHLETLEPVPTRAGPRVRQYFDDHDLTDLDPSFDLFGGGGLVSDARDLAGFWSTLFEGRVFDSPATLEQMCATVPDPVTQKAFALGLFSQRFGSVRAWCHTGFWGSFALHEPDAGITVAGATNQAASHLPDGALDRLQERLLDAAFEGSTH